ncbi:hypothetical protein ACFQ3N_04225 [Virgibacillus byunsanensis]|uniref:Uncharacterized protein n=1 Tax=Virgibacillus byunsanensis TaxID=570945 RepID=A0ABW3LK03_9BACI
MIFDQATPVIDQGHLEIDRQPGISINRHDIRSSNPRNRSRTPGIRSTASKIDQQT